MRLVRSLRAVRAAARSAWVLPFRAAAVGVRARAAGGGRASARRLRHDGADRGGRRARALDGGAARAAQVAGAVADLLSARLDPALLARHRVPIHRAQSTPLVRAAGDVRDAEAGMARSFRGLRRRN